MLLAILLAGAVVVRRGEEQAAVTAAAVSVVAGGQVRAERAKEAFDADTVDTPCRAEPAEEPCECYKERTCSSCTLDLKDGCPLGEIRYVTALGGGFTAKLRPDMASAYKVDTRSGKEWVIKFGGQDTKTKDFRPAVRYAQLAHALQVPTPRALSVNEETCPELFAAGELLLPRKEVEEWRKQGKKDVLVQEFVPGREGPEDGVDFLPCTMVGAILPQANEFWALVGRIALFDWMIGKVDLFNEIATSPSGQVLIDDTMETNGDNILETLSQPVDVDLDARNGGCCEQDFESLMRGLSLQGSGEPGAAAVDAWIEKHVFTILCNRAERLQCGDFGPYDPATPAGRKGFRGDAAKLLIKYGMLLAAKRVLDYPDFFRFGTQAALSLPTLLKPEEAERAIAAIEPQIQTKTARPVAPPEVQDGPKMCKKCEVRCEIKGKGWFAGYKDCPGRSYVPFAKDTSKCPRLQGHAPAFHCLTNCQARGEYRHHTTEVKVPC